MGQKVGFQMDTMRLLRIAAFFAVLILAWVLISSWASNAAKINGAGGRPGVTPWLDENDEETDEWGPICEENMTWDEPASPQGGDNPGGDLGWVRDRETMIREVVALWTMFFDDDEARQTDPRRSRFEEFAEYLVDAVIMYQDNPTDIGGQLPKHRNVHVLIAQIVTKESSVTYDVVGPQGEVGLMQIMPTNKAALAGYSPSAVQRNPRLGLLLGIRWLAHMTAECPRADIFKLGWNDYDWLGPLSVYAGGHKAKRQDGTCKAFTIARERIDKTLFYRTRIDHEMSSLTGVGNAIK